MSNRVNILVTGQPGIGKTTIIKNLYKRLSSPLLGFENLAQSPKNNRFLPLS